VNAPDNILIAEETVKSYTVDAVQFEELIKKHGSPLMIIWQEKLDQQYKLFTKELPKVKPFYAVKANPYPGIIKRLAALGANFDVASAAEIKWILDLGVSPERLLFANTIKSETDIKLAQELKVQTMTYDNEAELEKIAKNCPGAKVILRIKVDNLGSIIELSLKFGADPDNAISLLRRAIDLGLDPCGLSFHVGSQCTNADTFMQALEVVSEIYYVAKGEGVHLRLLDIGGGFPIRHFPDESLPPFETMARKINSELDRLFYEDVKFIAEPGRFFAGPAGTLITQVIGKSYREDKPFYYLNDGLYQDFSGIVFDHCKYHFKTFRSGETYLSTLAGPTCDSFDTISLSEDLPALEVGDIVYVDNIGAYSSASAVSAFNGIAPAKIIMI